MRPKRDGPAEAGPPGHAEKTSRLPLGELEPLARSGPSVLLPLHRARIAREEAGLLQWRPVVRIELGERAADPVTDGPSLPREPAAADDHGDVHLVELLDDLERLLEDHLAGLAPEVLVEGTVVDDELARAGLHPHPRDRLLAASGGGNDQVLGHLSRILCVGRFHGGWLLGGVGMLVARVDLQLLHQRAAERGARPQSACGVNMGLCLPRRTLAMVVAARPSTLSFTSMTTQLRWTVFLLPITVFICRDPENRNPPAASR